jgi:hypothetical protein
MSAQLDQARTRVTQARDDVRDVVRRLNRCDEMRYPTRFLQLKQELANAKAALDKVKAYLVEAEAAEAELPANPNQQLPVHPGMGKRGKKPSLLPDGSRKHPEGWKEQMLSQTVNPCPRCKADAGQPCVTTRKNKILNQGVYQLESDYKPVVANRVHGARLSSNG